MVINEKNSKIPTIQNIEKSVNILDKGIKVPVLPFRLPVDPIVGLVPFAGDIITLFLSGNIIIHAKKMGAPKNIQRKMAINALVDCIIGSIPFVGDIFDFFFKANIKNLFLLKRHIEYLETIDRNKRK